MEDIEEYDYDYYAAKADAHSCLAKAELSDDLEYYCADCGRNVTSEVNFERWKRAKEAEKWNDE